MRLSRKNLCWLLVVGMLFCAVCSGGCGGSSSSGGSGGGNSEDVYVPNNPNAESEDTPAPAPAPTSPDNPAPAPAPVSQDNTPSNDAWLNASGTWRIESATLEILSEGRTGQFTRPLAPTFEIIAGPDVMDFSGDGVETHDDLHFVKWYYHMSDVASTDGNDEWVMFPSGPLSRDNFSYVGNNTYKAEDEKGSWTISFPDSSTITFEDNWFDANYDRRERTTITIKRVN